MELTLDQALQRGIEAHKAGQVQEADCLYTAILKAQPKHPDANHNMGVLAVDVGKVEEALPFFKTALEVNPNTAQFWLSYIDALIKLERLEDARAVYDQAKEKGAQGDGFDKFEKWLNLSKQQSEGHIKKVLKAQDPPQDQLDALIELHRQGELTKDLEDTSKLLNKFPYSPILRNLSGVFNAASGEFAAAIDAYNKALSINPNYTDAYYNLGNVLQDQGKLNQAIEAFNEALSIKPDYAEIYYNTAIVKQNLGHPEKAIKACNKALALKPNYADVYNIMGAGL